MQLKQFAYLLIVVTISTSVQGNPNNLCICPLMPMPPNPVCGSDGESYPSECMFECQAKYLWDKYSTIIGIARTGNCIAVQEDMCGCKPDRYVCGSDDKTYSSVCEFKCRQAFLWREYQQVIRIVHYGPCI